MTSLARSAGLAALSCAMCSRAALAAPPNTVSQVTMTARSGSPTQPDVTEQKAALDSVAGSVGLVPAEAFVDRYANTLRDVLKGPGDLIVAVGAVAVEADCGSTGRTGC